MGTMVWCNSCSTVVWAYDHISADVRGICNMFRLACPNCGVVAKFNGYSLTPGFIEYLGAYDSWSAMREVAKQHNLIWAPSDDNTWRRYW